MSKIRLSDFIKAALGRGAQYTGKVYSHSFSVRLSWPTRFRLALGMLLVPLTAWVLPGNPTVTVMWENSLPPMSPNDTVKQR